MTTTGAKADKRVPATPKQQIQILKALTGGSTSGLPEKMADAVNKAKAQLQKAGSKALLVTGIPTVEAQTLALSFNANSIALRSEEHTSELQSRPHLVCRLLLEKKN